MLPEPQLALYCLTRFWAPSLVLLLEALLYTEDCKSQLCPLGGSIPTRLSCGLQGKSWFR